MERLTGRSNDKNDRRLSCMNRCYNAGDCINCDSFENAVDRLATYEDAEERGELVRLRWIPVTERLPIEKDRYLTVSIEPWFGTTVVDIMRWSGVWMYDGRQTEAKVTHWQQLPEPPEEET